MSRKIHPSYVDMMFKDSKNMECRILTSGEYVVSIGKGNDMTFKSTAKISTICCTVKNNTSKVIQKMLGE